MDIILTKDGKEITNSVEIDTNRVRMFIFSGAGLVTKQETISAEDSIKDIMKDSNIDINAVDFYPAYYSEKIEGETKSLNEGREPRAYSHDVAEKIFYPLISQSGERIDAKAAADNFEKIILRGHCMGATVVTETGNLLVSKMQELGYDEKEIKQITSKATALLSGSGVNYGTCKASFNTFSYVNLSDQTTEGMGYINETMSKLAGMDRERSPLQIKTIKPRTGETFVVANRLDMPSEEFVQNKILEKGELKENQTLENAVHDAFKKIRTGHTFSSAMNPINLEVSPFMQSLKGEITKTFSNAIRNVLQRGENGQSLGHNSIKKRNGR